MTDQRTQYTERTPWPRWVPVLMWGAILLSCYSVLAGGDAQLPVPVRVLIVLAIIALAVGATILFGGLTVLVQESQIFMHLGSVAIVRRRVPFADIESTESVTYRPLREFGGWGVRGWGKRKAWTARGDRAVALRLTGGREVLIGSDHPQRLEERIRAVMESGS